MCSALRALRCLLTLILICAAARTVHAGGSNETVATVAKSQVVLVRDPASVTGLSVDSNKARAMVLLGIEALTHEKQEAAAWSHFVSSNDVVGVKISTQSGPLQSTRRDVVNAIVQGLHAAGVNTTNIYVFDRDPLQMRAAGYCLRQPLAGSEVSVWKCQEVSIIDGTGWDPALYYQNNLAGKLIWGDLLFGKEAGEDLSKRSHLSKLVTETITKLINVPVMQDHDVCGLAGCLYNFSLGMVDNTRRFEMPGQHGDPMIAEICAMQPVRGKLVLNVMDGLIGGYAGGPSFKPQYSWNYGALYFSADPVAIDSLCVEALDAKRHDAKVPPIGLRASHITTAARLGLGASSTNQIEVIRVSP